MKEQLKTNPFFLFLKNKKIYFPWMLLSGYLFFVLFADIMLTTGTITLMLAIGSFFLVFSMIVSFFCLYFLSKVTLKSNCIRSKRALHGYFIVSFCIILGVMVIYLLAHYPGGFSEDSLNQYSQALTGSYTDWHPYIHTLLFFTLPMYLCAEVWFIVLLQAIYYALAVAYCIKTLARLQAHFWVIASTLIFFTINVSLNSIMLFPWKDCALIIFSLVAITQFANIYFTKGQWLAKKRNCIAFGIILALATLVRHNAILFTLPLAFIVLLFYFKNIKRVLLALAIFALLVFIAKVPLYQALDVETPGYRTVELVGLPMSIIAEAVSVEPELRNEELLTFAYEIAPQTYWEEYNGYGWNDFKWESDWSLIEGAGAMQILQYMMQALNDATTTSIKGFLRTTSCVWSLTRDLTVTPYIASNSYGLISNYQPALLSVITVQTAINTIISNYIPLNYLLCSVGFCMLLLLLAACTRITSIFEKLLLIAPIFCYNLGTMLLLTGQDTRFFFYTVAIFPMLLFLLFSPIQSDLDETLCLFATKHIPLIQQAVKFVLISGIGWLIDLVIFTLLTRCGLDIALANAISSSVGVTYVYILSLHKVFAQAKNKGKYKYLFYVAYQIVIIGLNSNVIRLLSLQLGVNGVLMKLLTTPVTLVLNFIFMKWLLEKFEIKKEHT